MSKLTVLLARHGYAESMAEDDSQRALTGEGRRHARQIGSMLQEQAPALDAIFTSPLVRAVQTAEIFAAATGIDSPIAARLAIAEPPTLESLTDFISSLHVDLKTVLIVGHQPTMGLLVTALAERPAPASFSPASVVSVEFEARGELGRIRWMLTGTPPQIIRVD